MKIKCLVLVLGAIALLAAGCATRNAPHAGATSVGAKGSPFPPCNVMLIGFGAEAADLRLKINKIMMDAGNGHDSIVTIIGNCDVKCVEIPTKNEPYIRVYSDNLEGGKRFAEFLSKTLNLTVEFQVLDGIFIPKG